MKKSNIEDILALTPMQQGMLFHYLKDPESDAYFEQLSLSLSGKIAFNRFEKSWNFVIQTNEMLRVVFRWEKVEHPVQIILKEYKFQPKYYDFSGNDTNKMEQAASKSEKEIHLEEIKAKDRQKKFDLREVPFRVTLCKVEEDEYEMIISNHHILYDGWSNGIILKEFLNAYNNLSNGKDLVRPVKTKFREFIKWNQNRDIEKQRKFWRNYLKGVDTQIEISIKQKRKGKEITKTGTELYQIRFDREMKDKIDDFVKNHKITLPSLLYSAWGVLLQNYNNSDDVVFGTTVSGRNAKVQGIQDIVGLLINSVPLRIQNHPNEKTGDLLHRIDRSLQMREEYEAASLVSIKEYSEINDKKEFFDTIMIIANYPLDSRSMMANTDSSLCFESYSIVEMTHYDLTVGVIVSSDIKINFYYKKDCFDQQVIVNMANHFTNIVHEFLRNPGKGIPEIEILSPKERTRLLEFNNTWTNYPIDKTVHELFEEESEKNPDHIAVVFEDEQITYGELNKRANRMARLLRAKGVKNDSIVGLMLDRSINMMIGILGILKAGGAYLPIDKDYPKNRIISMLEDSRALLLLTSTAVAKKHSFTALQNIKTTVVTPHLTDLRPQIKEIDNLPIPDRSLVDYGKYSKGIGMAMARNTIAIQATRGCPFKCLYCHKIWPKSHIARSAEHIFAEVRLYYGMGVRRFVFIDDIFNLNKENSARFFKLVIENGLDIQMFFPNGIRGDLLSREYIDLMVEAGTINIALALETASPRLQKLIGKNINLDKLHENMDYICKKYPQVISELFTMHEFPTETEEEALMTLDFIKTLKWLHIPLVNILKIYPNTDMAKFALENGISMEDIIDSENLAYHELPTTLPFDKKFTLKYQTDFTNEYFLSKERLLHVLPHQMKILTESEIVEKYNSFLPTMINSFADLLQFAGIDGEELGGEDCLGEEYTALPGLYEKMKNHFPAKKPFSNALRVILLDLSQFFSSEAGILYDVIEPPLGLMYVMTYLQKQLGSKINGKIAKSRIDFDNYSELKALLDEFKPDVIGIRTLTYYKEFFHKTVAMIRNWGFDVPIIAGGPYATSDYTRILQDGNIDLVVLGEGEITFNEIISKIFANNKKLPGDEILKKIPGIAFIPEKKDCYNELNREILMADELTDVLSKESGRNLEKINQSSDLAYVMYTSGSTGRSKGVMVTHKNAVRLVKNTDYVEFTPGIRVLQTGAPVFDATTFEIWGSLLNGGLLYLVEKDVILDANMLGKALVDNRINTLWLSSPLFNQLMQQNSDIFSSLKYLVVGGDVLSTLYINMVRSKNKSLKVVNGYGPTENTTFSTCYLVYKDFEENIPIGKPIRNSTAYILAKHGCLQPIGVKGELCVGGDGVSRGYLNSPELTAEKFDHDLWDYLDYQDEKKSTLSIKNYKLQNTNHNIRNYKQKNNQKLLRGGLNQWVSGSVGQLDDSQAQLGNPLTMMPRPHPEANENQHKRFAQHIGSPRRGAPGRRRQSIYKTGDLARWLPDGNIEFFGREDHQVKIRGFRVDPGEIENLLINHDQIKEVVVLVRETNGGDSRSADSRDKFLCAYFVSDKKIAVSELREYLFRELPDYMVPAYMMRIDKIPLNPNGKIDRKELPDPEAREDKENYAAPRNNLEKKLVEIWAEVLKIEKKDIGIDDNFFELGGHSLKATVMLSKVHKMLGIKLPLQEIYENPEIRGLSRYIARIPGDKYSSIGFAEEKEFYELSSAQKRLYVLQEMKPEGTSYNTPMTVVLEGNLDREKLEQAFRTLINRHESLRTSFEIVNEEPVQIIRDKAEFALEYYQVEVEEEEGTINNFIRPFDLSQPPLLRVGLIRLTHSGHPRQGTYTSQEVRGDRYLLMVDMHHIIIDGTSMDLFVKEFMAVYADKQLPPLRLQYRDYSEWQNKGKYNDALRKQAEYWHRCFEGEIPLLNLPTDYDRPTSQSFEGNRVSFDIGSEDTGALKVLALKEGTTLYTVLLSMYSILLSKISSQEDIVIGTPVAGRRHDDLGGIIGMFVNTLALRNYPVGEISFKAFLKDVNARTLSAFENQDYQYEDLVERIVVGRDTGRNPIFDTMFVMQNVDIPDIEIPGLKLKPYEYETGIAKFDLTFIVESLDDRLHFTAEYCTKLFKAETIERFTRYFRALGSVILKETGGKISDLEIITKEEKRKLLVDFNRRDVEYPVDKTIHELFEEQVERTPYNIAVVGPHELHEKGTRGLPPLSVPICITYKELKNKSDQLALLLSGKGVRPDTVVAIMVERSIEMIIAILGILKADGAYMPIDPECPEDRKQYMIKDSGAKILLTKQEIAGLFSIHPFTLHSSHPHLSLAPATSNSLAYIMYTSGSTGNPKGVMVEHRNAVNVISWFAQKYQVRNNIHVLQMSDYTFDPSVNQIFGSLLHGAVLYLVPQEFILDSKRMGTYIDKHQIHIINFVPLILNEILGQNPKLESIRVVLSGGDRLDESIKDNIIKRGYELYNQYGPTETTIDALVSKCSPGKVTLGKPISNVECYILDKNNHVSAIGVVGEIYIGGAGVSRGYLNNPVLTAEKFCLRRPGAFVEKTLFCPVIPHKNFLLFPLHSPYSPIYRTGDLGHWLPEGTVEFLGRIDQQLKIRGFRIELGEIENQLLKHNEIRGAVVLTGEDMKGDRYLCAYIVPTLSPSSKAFDVTGLRNDLLKFLPDYMIPSYFVQVDDIPLTVTGKIDRSALPLPEIGPGEEYIAPRDEVEEKLIDIWSEVLRIKKEEISIDANFFQLGGYSLKAAALVLKIHKELGVKLPLAEVFTSNTIRKLSEYIKSSEEERYVSIEPTETKDYYASSPAQKRMYVLHRMGVMDTNYNIPATFVLEGTRDTNLLEETFSRLVNRHESLRTSFRTVESEPVQEIHEEVTFSVEKYDLTKVSCDKEVALDQEKIINSFVRPFELDKAPLLRVGLIKIDKKKHILMIDMHHIISDGISGGIFLKEFMGLYHGKKLPPVRIQYKDFSEWQKKMHEQAPVRIKGQEEYWLKKFKGDLPQLNLLTDYERPPIQSHEGSLLNFEIGPDETVLLKKIAHEEEVTLFTLLLTIYHVFLTKLSGQEDIVVGTVTAGRDHPDLQQVIGMFVNMLAVRNNSEGKETFAEFLKEVHVNTLEAFENQDYPFEDLVAKIISNRDFSRNALFDVGFSLQNIEVPELEISKVKIKPYELKHNVSKFDLSLAAVERGEKLVLAFEYCVKLFNQTTIEEFAEYLKEIVLTVVNNKEVQLEEIKISHKFLEANLSVLPGIQVDFDFQSTVSATN